MWKERIKTNFYGQYVPHDMYDSVYKQVKNYYPQVYVEACKYTDAENRQCNMLSDVMMMDFLRCKKERKKSLL